MGLGVGRAGEQESVKSDSSGDGQGCQGSEVPRWLGLGSIPPRNLGQLVFRIVDGLDGDCGNMGVLGRAFTSIMTRTTAVQTQVVVTAALLFVVGDVFNAHGIELHGDGSSRGGGVAVSGTRHATGNKGLGKGAVVLLVELVVNGEVTVSSMGGSDCHIHSGKRWPLGK